MSIKTIQRKRGTKYQANVRYQGRQRKRSFDTYDEAEAWEQWVRSGNDPDAFGQSPVGEGVAELPTGRMTFEQLAAEWWTHHAEVELVQSSQYQAALALKKYLIPAFGSMPLDAIQPVHVRQWWTKLRSGKRGDDYNAILLGRLKQILCWGLVHELLERDPSRSVTPPRRRRRRRGVPRFLSREEIDLLLTVARYTDRGRTYLPAWSTLIGAGLRRGELVALHKDQIDRSKRVFDINHHYCQRQRKRLSGTKSGEDITREVPISDALWLLLEPLLHSDHGPHLFCHHKGGPLLYSQVQYELELACESAGISGVTPHTLRHTYASHHMMNGGDLYVLRDLMGHADITTTQVYAHLSPDFREDRGRNVVVLPALNQ